MTRQRNKKKPSACRIYYHNMDLNTLQLTTHTLTDLYKNSIVALDNEPVRNIEAANADPAIKFLGENRKNILIVVNYPDNPYVPDEQLNLLTNFLAACKMNLSDVAVFNLYPYLTHDHSVILQFFKSKVIFLFAVEPGSLSLPINFPHFQLQQFNGTTYLFSPSLNEIGQDPVLKSKLWVCLRRIFNI